MDMIKKVMLCLLGFLFVTAMAVTVGGTLFLLFG